MMFVPVCMCFLCMLENLRTPPTLVFKIGFVTSMKFAGLAKLTSHMHPKPKIVHSLEALLVCLNVGVIVTTL